jgi:hypothetical protein
VSVVFPPPLYCPCVLWVFFPPVSVVFVFIFPLYCLTDPFVFMGGGVTPPPIKIKTPAWACFGFHLLGAALRRGMLLFFCGVFCI